MLSEKEAIAVVWVIGIGLAALLSSFMLVYPGTRNWSELRIVACSMGVSILLIALLLYLMGGL